MRGDQHQQVTNTSKSLVMSSEFEQAIAVQYLNTISEASLSILQVPCFEGCCGHDLITAV